MNLKIKSVAVAISPLILSFTALFLLFVLLNASLSPYIGTLGLFLNEGSQAAEPKEPENIFQGYEGEKDVDVVDGNTITYPKRGALYATLSVQTEKCSLFTDVYFDDSDAALNRGGVGQNYGTKPAGFGTTILIAGHNNGKFNALQFVEVGDVITMTTSYGIFQYQVREAKVMPASSYSSANLKYDTEELVLYTCYPFTALGLTNQRFFVFADKISGPVVK